MDSINIRISTQGKRLAKYPAKSHAQRVARALRSNDCGTILLRGEASKYYSNSDQPRHFRQDRYFYYLTGCNEPDCYVSYDIAKDILTLWLPPIDLSRVFYNGRGSTTEEALEKYDIDKSEYIRRDEAELFQRLETKAQMVRGFQQEDRLPRRQGTSPNTLAKPHLGLRDLWPALDRCRAVKDSDEIALIRKANEISSKAHREVLKHLRHLNQEAEAEGLYMNVCISNGGKEQAYGPIVGSGPNAGILHYQANNEAFGDRQVLLIDAGCEWELYAADITRTMPLNIKNPGHWPSKESEAIYKAVEKIQEECIAILRPGVNFIDVNIHARSMATDALLKLGILKGKKEEIMEDGTVSAFFPHGLGHHLGLEVHDLMPPPETDSASEERDKRGDGLLELMKLRPLGPGHALDASLFMDSCKPSTPSLEPENVVTIEPGLYFNKFILDNFILNNPKHKKFIDVRVLERYMPVGGVRIEDDILITKHGYENLTPAAKGEEMLKIIRGEA